ncbi:insulin-like isoform X2 [Pomacea canaliculata]|nr:insulin-like isoform X2 [Pomacea canaliculata]
MKTLVVTLLAMLAATYVHSGGNPDRPSGRRLCGQQLADTLDMVCGQTGFNWRKRSADDTKTAGREPRSLMAGVRQGRSVADECCRQGPCTIQILESYCASSVEGASENMRSYLISMLNGPQMASTTTTPETTAATARPGSNSPAAEVFRGPSWRNSSNFKQFFYLPVNSRPTRSPLIFK